MGVDVLLMAVNDPKGEEQQRVPLSAKALVNMATDLSLNRYVLPMDGGMVVSTDLHAKLADAFASRPNPSVGLRYIYSHIRPFSSISDGLFAKFNLLSPILH